MTGKLFTKQPVSIVRQSDRIWTAGQLLEVVAAGQPPEKRLYLVHLFGSDDAPEIMISPAPFNPALRELKDGSHVIHLPDTRPHARYLTQDAVSRLSKLTSDHAHHVLLLWPDERFPEESV